MSAQMKRNEEEQHPAAYSASGSAGGVAEGGEKKSMLKKVKAKAKKIKDTITKPGHGHAHPHDGVDDDDDDDDNNEVGEIEQGQHVHGAPIIDESKEARSSVPGQRGAPIQGDVMLGVGGGDRTPTAPEPVDGKDVSDSIKTNTNTNSNREAVNESKEKRSNVPGRQGAASIKRDVMSGVGHPTPTPAVGTDSNSTSSPHETNSTPRGDRQPDNYQSKAKDLTGRGGEEVGATPILHSFDKMGLHTDVSKQSNAKTTTGQQESFIQPNAAGVGDSLSSGAGSHDQFSPEPISDKTTVFSPHPETEMEQDIGDSGPRQQGASYTDKVSSATSLIADKAFQAKNVVASKLGYNGGEDDHQKTNIPLHDGQDEAAGKTSSVMDNGKKVGSAVQAKASPMYDTAVSAKEYIAEKASPGEEDKALSEMISGALHKDTAGSRQGEEDEKKRGKVTISDKVAGQLGRGDERSVEEIGSGGSGPGETVVEMMRGTVTSWLGMGGETEPSSVVFHDIPKEENEGSGGHKLQQGQGTDGEPRLQ